MLKFIAEGIGTFVLVFFGVGSAVLAGVCVGLSDPIGIAGISLAFGILLVAMACSIGQVSGAHPNPAMSFGCLVAGRMQITEFTGYVVCQVIGAAFVVFRDRRRFS
ncbi:MAG: aquaporin [Pseudomonadota bacterium]